jgi:transposase
MPFKSARLKITKKQPGQLAAITRKQTAPAAEVVSEDCPRVGGKKPYRVLGSELGVSSATIALLRNRFEDYGVAGLISVHPGKAPSKLTAAVRAKVLARTQQASPDGSKHWSCRKMAEALNLSKTLVHRIWQESDLKPHRLDRYMASNDPDFEKNAADIIGLYLHPPQHVPGEKRPEFQWRSRQRKRDAEQQRSCPVWFEGSGYFVAAGACKPSISALWKRSGAWICGACPRSGNSTSFARGICAAAFLPSTG